AVINEVVARARGKAATVQPYHHRSRAAVCSGRKYVQPQTVFAFFFESVHREHDGCRLADTGLLVATRTHGKVIAHAAPGSHRLWRHEAIGAGSRCAIRQVPELLYAFAH